MLTVLVFILLAIIILPAVIVIPQSFTSLNYFTYPIPDYVLKWYSKFWENSEWVVGLGRSLAIAVVVAVVATVLGTMAAVAMQKLEFKGKGLFMGLVLSPMVIPVVIIGVALYSTFSKVGLTNSFLGLILTHTLLAMPMVFVTMSSGLGGVNSNLELAAMSMGSTPIGAFFKVVLPTVKPSLISSILFSFVTSLDEVAASLFISGADTKTLPLVMWERLNTYMDPTIAVAATFLIILTLGTYIVKEIIDAKTNKIY
jgi:putative spermidine/putrescine transport system permease protein